MAEHPAAAKDVLAICEQNDVRFVRLWFTDVLGQLKSFSINAAELEDAFEGGMGFDGSSITGFNPIEESDMIAMPDPTTFALIPWRPEEEKRVARMFCDIRVPGGEPYEGDPRWIMRRALKRAEEMGFDAYNIGPELEFFYFRSAEARGRRPRGPRRGRLLRPDHARRRLRRAPRDGPGAGEDRDPRRVHPPRGRPLPARGRHALQGRARDGRRLHDLPDHGQGVRDEVRLARHLHAEAAVRRERLRHARPPVALARTARTPSSTPTTSTSSPTRRRLSSPASSSTRARSRRSSPSGSTPTSAWCRATRRRSTWPGHGATARP